MKSDSQINDGGPAFPKTGSFTEDVDSSFDSKNQDGMTLRAWLAGQALAGLATLHPDPCLPADIERLFGQTAVALADHTLAALEQPSQPNK